MVMWAKFRLPSTESLKNKTRVVGEGKGMVLAWGGVLMKCFFAHARPTLAVLWTFPHTFPEDTNFGKHGDEGQRRRGMGKTVVVGGGGDKTSRPMHM
jgi:hypothetical protein